MRTLFVRERTLPLKRSPFCISTRSLQKAEQANQNKKQIATPRKPEEPRFRFQLPHRNMPDRARTRLFWHVLGVEGSYEILFRQNPVLNGERVIRQFVAEHFIRMLA